MNESETRAELIDPKLKQSGWGVVEGSKILKQTGKPIVTAITAKKLLDKPNNKNIENE